MVIKLVLLKKRCRCVALSAVYIAETVMKCVQCSIGWPREAVANLLSQ